MHKQYTEINIYKKDNGIKCPYCGEIAVINSKKISYRRKIYRVKCLSCRSMTYNHSTKAAALVEWENIDKHDTFLRYKV